MTMAEAIEGGADAFFDEKYGETVRTIRVEDYSFELCGGTHCRATGQIGSFVITGERSIGSGMRRIEALTGAGADAYLRQRTELLDAAAEAAGARSVEAVIDRVTALQDELRDARRKLKAGGGVGIPKAGELAAAATEVAPGVRLAAAAHPYASMDALKAAARDLSGVLGSGVVALGLDAEEPQLFVTVSDDLVARGISAGDLVNAAMPAIDGRGGGRATMAQGRGSRQDGLPDALAAIRARLEHGT
jgi:alanyl-tRNA synthetase